MSNMSTDDLQKAVHGWLKEQGFPLEMKVANVLSTLGFGIRQGWYFTDPEEGKPREIDILAFCNINTGHPLMLQFIIECKWSKKPFVVFSYSDRTPKSPNPELQQANPVGKQFVNKIVSNGIINQLSLFSPTSPLGYAMTQAQISMKSTNETGQSSNKDEAFDALMKVAKATYSILQYYTTRSDTVSKEGDAAQYVLAYLAFPMIVVDAPLFDCYLNEKGDAIVTPISQVLVNWSYPLLGNLPIRVCTLDALPSVANQALETWAQLALHKIDL
ncbi:MAG: hypothetical protein HY863_00060 [Chloroflexi bacterium]|nr:hypothetical protein [Chloroflexota bacterium]